MKHRPKLWRDREAVADKPATWAIVCEACAPTTEHRFHGKVARGAILREHLSLLDAAPLGEAHEREHAA